jgi:ATP-dependent protease ClpP protease subunit
MEIDLDKINKEVADSVGSMSQEDIEKELTELRVRQKVAQKKYQSPERQKAYQAKQKERRRLLKERAIQLGIYDQINEKAGELADAKLAAEEAESDED